MSQSDLESIEHNYTKHITSFRKILQFMNGAKQNLALLPECHPELSDLNANVTEGYILQILTRIESIKNAINDTIGEIQTIAIKNKIQELLNVFSGIEKKHDVITPIFAKLKQQQGEVERSEHCNDIAENLNEIEMFVEDCIQWCKKIVLSVDQGDQYPVQTSTKPAYVVMFVNLEFTDSANNLHLQPDIDAAKALFTIQRGFALQNIDNYKNLKLDATIKKINELRTLNFNEYSSLVIIYDSHGENDGTLMTADCEYIKLTDFFEACDQNETLIKKPVIMIIDACRGRKEDRTVTCKANTLHRFHPAKPNALIAFAAANDNVAWPSTVGSLFLIQLFKVITDQPTSDILALITVATKNVLDNCRRGTGTNQTVTYVSLLPRQFRFSGANLDNWGDVEKYEPKQRTLFYFHRDNPTNYQDTQERMKLVMIAAGFQHCLAEEELQGYDVHAVICITFGRQSDSEIHRNLLRNLQNEFSFIRKSTLTGRPKIFLNLGQEYPPVVLASVGNTSGVKSVGTMPSFTVSENSDCLSYCDKAEGWYKAICDVITRSPGNDVGLVRLLTEAIRRPEALASPDTPHIQSTLRLKLVIPKYEKVPDKK